MNLLGIHRQPLSESVLALKLVKSDESAWPDLPQGVLERRHNQSKRPRFNMSLDESMHYLDIRRKPEEEWTRHERRFIQEMHSRA
jgi:hypothetical protein